MSSNEWRIFKLDELLLKRNQGVNTTTEKVKYSNTGIPVIRAQNILPSGLSFNDITFVDEETFKRVRPECKPLKNDILYTNIGSQFGTACKVNNNFPFLIAWNVLRLQPNSQILPEFLIYTLNNPVVKAKIQSLNSSSTMPFVSGKEVGNVELKIPNLAVQNKIASILSALDEKIENNSQTNQTLEEIAKNLFKEWFVNFNYPNADGNKKHSELGEIPTNWKVGVLGDIYKTTSGGTPSRAKMEYYENGIYHWVKSKELNNTFIIGTEEKITEEALRNSSAKVLPKNSVLIAMYGATVGEIGITTEAVTCNQAICAFIANVDYPYTFIYQFLLQSKQDIINQAVGSAQQNISQQLLQQYKLVIPSTETVKAYHAIVSPLFGKIQDNMEENVTLVNLRDSLLPKLMSGQIPITISN